MPHINCLGYKGKCQNLHGHEWKLEVEVSRETLIDNMVLDFTILNSMVNQLVIDRLDHEFLNNIIPYPTAENILIWISEQLINPLWTGYKVDLESLTLWETHSSKAIWRRNK